MSTRSFNLFTHHSRSWHANRYTYPVVSRRANGLSIGVNLNPDKACNFDCIYCSVDRTVPSTIRVVDLAILKSELSQLLDLAGSGEIWRQRPFDQTPEALRRINDVAFSGDGEPTSFRRFGAACVMVADLLAQRSIDPAPKIVLITNATLLHLPRITEALQYLDSHNGEIWAKLDAGTEPYYHLIERTGVPLQRVLDNILETGRARPIVIQSLFMNVRGADPDAAEIDAYIDRLRSLKSEGCQIKLVQVYTVARAPTEAYVTPLANPMIDEITQRVREIGLEALPFYAPT